MPTSVADLKKQTPLRNMKLDNKNILLVENGVMINQLFEKRLSQAGDKVFTALNGKQVFEKLKENKINFILLDLIMPEIGGHEMLQHLKENPDTKDIPVIMLTN